jgi:hypothetical protein
MSNALPDLRGYFGAFGGRFVPETLMAPLLELTAAYHALRHDPKFKKELAYYFKNFVGRPTPLMYARRLSEAIGRGRRVVDIKAFPRPRAPFPAPSLPGHHAPSPGRRSPAGARHSAIGTAVKKQEG